jgi:glycosyltransferase involved in cell wall biosynthesis
MPTRGPTADFLARPYPASAAWAGDHSAFSVASPVGIDPHPAQAVDGPAPGILADPAFWNGLGKAGKRLLKARRLLNRSTWDLSGRVIQEQGAAALLRFWHAKLAPEAAYARWIQENEPTATELAAQRSMSFPRMPRISLVVPTYNTKSAHLSEMVTSVLAQTYANWELCIADGASQASTVKEILHRCRAQDQRIRVAFLAANRGIAGNSNAALSLATGDYIALLDHDDTLAPFALHDVVQAINRRPGTEVLYSDEDKIDATGRQRKDHHFKPDWSPDTLRSQNYITHLAVYQRRLMQEVGGLRPGFDGSQDYDLILRATERARQIVHIPRVLYHWRSHPLSAAGDETAKLYAYDAGKRALGDHLSRLGISGKVSFGPVLGTYAADFALPRHPLVSIILMGGDRQRRYPYPHSPRQSRYDRIELITANVPCFGRRDHGGGGIAQALNGAVSRARGEVLLFLDHHLAPRCPNWLEHLLSHALRPEVGAVGAKITNASDGVAHAGIIFGVAGLAGYSHRHFARSERGYGCRLISTQNLSAVSRACLMTRRDVFQSVGGFDPGFAAECHDWDFCLRVRKAGLVVVWTPRAELGCWLGAAGFALTSSGRRAADRRRFREKWAEVLQAGDPYYNPNLTLDWEDFSLRLGPASWRPRSASAIGGT